jgi:hypothetical protein
MARINKRIVTAFIFIVIWSSARTQTINDSLDACWLVTHNVDASFIQKNAKRIVSHGKDNCVMAFIDKIVNGTFKGNGREYFYVLASICKVSDGYVTDYLDDAGVKLFNKNFDNLFRFMYRKNSMFDTPLEKMIVEGMGIRIADSKDKESTKKNIGDFIEEKKKGLRMTSNQNDYINGLKKKIFDFSDR